MSGLFANEPPNRIACLYCGADLGLPTGDLQTVKVKHRTLEDWEHGFNVVLIERPTGDVDLEKASQNLPLDEAQLEEIVNAGTPLPLSRAENETAAQILTKTLSELGLICTIVPDAEIPDDKFPVRLRGMDLTERYIALIDFNTSEVTETPLTELEMVVSGVIATSRLDSLENKRRRGASKLIEGTVTTTDEPVVDLYPTGNSVGYRVLASGFDFSCLGPAKGILASENIVSLVSLLRERAPKAKFVDDYASIRGVLGHVWEIESRKDPKGLQRSGFGRKAFASTGTTNNLRQFTKYSRLQRHLV